MSFKKSCFPSRVFFNYIQRYFKAEFFKKPFKTSAYNYFKTEARNFQVGCLIQVWQHAKMQTLLFPQKQFPAV